MNTNSLLYRLHIDATLLTAIVILSAAGLLVLYSASGQDTSLVVKQAIRLAVGFVAMFALTQISPDTLARWSPVLYAAGLLLLLGVLIVGTSGKGAKRWLDLGFVSFQPSELMKILVPLVIARYFMDRGIPPSVRSALASTALLLIPTFLIIQQPDLGTGLLVFLAGFYVIFLTGLSWRWLIGAAILASCSAPLLWWSMLDYQKQRIRTLFDSETDPLGAGYHTIQAKIAVGSGGLSGKGWLNGTQSNLEFLPERSTDFIFAVYCEEFGFTGVLALLLVYGIIISRGVFIAFAAQTTFGRLLASGLILTFFTYVFVNIGMVIGRLPIVGIPLPLISYGGTSVVSLLAGIGILMSIHTHRRLLSN
jgi:rod shape determining protein RodA